CELRQTNTLGDLSAAESTTKFIRILTVLIDSEEENEPKALASLLVGGNRGFAKCCIEREACGKTTFVSRQDPQYRDQLRRRRSNPYRIAYFRQALVTAYPRRPDHHGAKYGRRWRPHRGQLHRRGRQAGRLHCCLLYRCAISASDQRSRPARGYRQIRLYHRRAR